MNRISMATYVRSWWIALRPFSLSLALASVGTGMLAVWSEGPLGSPVTWHLAALILVAGLASQAWGPLVWRVSWVCGW